MTSRSDIKFFSWEKATSLTEGYDNFEGCRVKKAFGPYKKGDTFNVACADYEKDILEIWSSDIIAFRCNILTGEEVLSDADSSGKKEVASKSEEPFQLKEKASSAKKFSSKKEMAERFRVEVKVLKNIYDSIVKNKMVKGPITGLAGKVFAKISKELSIDEFVVAYRSGATQVVEKKPVIEKRAVVEKKPSSEKKLDNKNQA